MMRHIRIAAASVAILTAILATPIAAQDAPTARADSALKRQNCAPTGNLRGDVDRGANLHLKHCAECHGADGKANVIVMHMDVTPQDQSDPAYMKTLSDPWLYVAVCKGGLGVGKNVVMPAWGDVLTDQDIKDLIAHIRTLSGT